MFPIFSFFSDIRSTSPTMRQKAVLDDRTPAQRKREEVKREASRKKRDRRKLAKKLNRGNQFAGRR